LERKPKYETLTGETRQRYQRNEKERIVTEREYLNLHLNLDALPSMRAGAAVGNAVLLRRSSGG
jgi:hypothetical protein